MTLARALFVIVLFPFMLGMVYRWDAKACGRDSWSFIRGQG